MIDFKLDTKSRDLSFPLQPLDGAERVAQAIGIRLRCWLGEWFLDTTHGVPYLEKVLGKVSRPEIVEAVLRNQILTVAGVKSIKNFSLQIDPLTRRALVNYAAESKEGLVKGSVSIQN